jgi:hypothetical protein
MSGHGARAAVGALAQPRHHYRPRYPRMDPRCPPGDARGTPGTRRLADDVHSIIRFLFFPFCRFPTPPHFPFSADCSRTHSQTGIVRTLSRRELVRSPPRPPVPAVISGKICPPWYRRRRASSEWKTRRLPRRPTTSLPRGSLFRCKGEANRSLLHRAASFSTERDERPGLESRHLSVHVRLRPRLCPDRKASSLFEADANTSMFRMLSCVHAAECACHLETSKFGHGVLPFIASSK